jgi:hypothetical protein
MVRRSLDERLCVLSAEDFSVESERCLEDGIRCCQSVSTAEMKIADPMLASSDQRSWRGKDSFVWLDGLHANHEQVEDHRNFRGSRGDDDEGVNRSTEFGDQERRE